MRLPQTLRDGVIDWMPDGQEWADSLPALLERCRQRWQLSVGEPFDGGYTAWVAPAERADGSSCVLKLPYPEDLSRHEPDALLLWDGDGAVRLLERDEETRALLLERLRPGTSLFALGDPEEALTVACAALQRLWRPPPAEHPFATAQACAADWAVEIERQYRAHAQPFDAALLHAAVQAFEQLARYDGDSVVLHQDFHRGNVLRAQREPWLAIDPKPLAGERAFDARWLLYDLLYREPRSALPAAGLLDRLAAELSLDPERVRLWTLARAVENALWGYESGEADGDDVALASALM
jgi:streptomycin 6-kinase